MSPSGPQACCRELRSEWANATEPAHRGRYSSGVGDVWQFYFLDLAAGDFLTVCGGWMGINFFEWSEMI